MNLDHLKGVDEAMEVKWLGILLDQARHIISAHSLPDSPALDCWFIEVGKMLDKEGES